MTSSRYRTVLPCAVKFLGYMEIRFELMVKLYHQGNGSVDKGLPLTTLSLEYTYGEGDADEDTAEGSGKLHEITYQ